MSVAQETLKTAVRRAYEPRSVLVNKTRPEHRELCAGCGGRVDPAAVCIYQLCDRCLGIKPTEGARVKFGQDSGLESEANSLGAEAVVTEEKQTVSYAAFEKHDFAAAENDPTSFTDYTVQDPETGFGALSKKPPADEFRYLPHAMNGKTHKLTSINEEYRLATCEAHGHRVRIQVRDMRNGKPRWRCGAANEYRQPRNGGGTVIQQGKKVSCCGEGGECAACPLK